MNVTGEPVQKSRVLGGWLLCEGKGDRDEVGWTSRDKRPDRSYDSSNDHNDTRGKNFGRGGAFDWAGVCTVHSDARVCH